MLTEALRPFVNNTEVPLTLADARQPDLPLTIVNPAFERLTGYAAENIVGRNCRFLQGDLSQGAERMKIRKLIEDQVDGQVVLHNIKRSGEPFLNLLFLYPIFHKGELTFFLGSQFEARGAQVAAQGQERGRYLQERIDRLRSENEQLHASTRRSTSNAVASAIQTLLVLRSSRAE